MRNKDYAPEDHEEAKRLHAVNGPKAFGVFGTMSSGRTTPVLMADRSYLAYLPEVWRKRMRLAKRR